MSGGTVKPVEVGSDVTRDPRQAVHCLSHPQPVAGQRCEFIDRHGNRVETSFATYGEITFRRENYENGGWADGRLGKAYDLVWQVLEERGIQSLGNSLLRDIEGLDQELSAEKSA